MIDRIDIISYNIEGSDYALRLLLRYKKNLNGLLVSLKKVIVMYKATVDKVQHLISLR